MLAAESRYGDIAAGVCCLPQPRRQVRTATLRLAPQGHSSPTVQRPTTVLAIPASRIAAVVLAATYIYNVVVSGATGARSLTRQTRTSSLVPSQDEGAAAHTQVSNQRICGAVCHAWRRTRTLEFLWLHQWAGRRKLSSLPLYRRGVWALRVLRHYERCRRRVDFLSTSHRLSLIEHRYVGCDATDSGCDGGL